MEEHEDAGNPAMHIVTSRSRVGYDPDDDQDSNNESN
jgi:hypothetical protein